MQIPIKTSMGNIQKYQLKFGKKLVTIFIYLRTQRTQQVQLKHVAHKAIFVFFNSST